VLGHLGEALPFWLWRLDNLYRLTYGWAADALGMIRLELTPSEYIKRNFWVTTSGMYDPQIMSYIVQRLGADRVMFAVDYPYEDSRVAPDFLAATALDERSRAQINHETAERLFRVPR
jgi:5-carboxyvanillate decarboxylase